MPSAHTPQTANAATAWQRFRRWRRARPFWGGLLLILSGIELFLSSNLNLGAVQVHIGPTGFLSYVIPAMLLLCGGGTWATPHLRLFYGILGSLVAVYSLIGLNLGGFMVGLLLGIVGGALTIAWTPVQATTPTADAPATEDESETVPAAAIEQDVYDDGQRFESYPGYGDTVEIPRQTEGTQAWRGGSQTGPRHSQEEPPSYGTGSGDSHSRILAITLVPVTLAAALLTFVQKSTPAYAAPCPPPTATAASAAPKAAASAGAKAATPQKGPVSGQAAAPQKGQAPVPQSSAVPGTAEPAPSASASSPAAAPKSDGNLFSNALNGLVNGVKKLFGAGESATPSDPAPSASATSSPSPDPSAGASAGPGPSVSAPAALPGAATPSVLPGSGKPQPRSSAAAAANGPATAATCVNATATVDSNQPNVAVTPGVITAKVQDMANFTYEGVVDNLPTKDGPIRALKFTMTQAVTEPFTLKVPERDGKSTQITSTKLTIEGQTKTVEFYTSKFTGTLTGLGLPVIPIHIPLPPILRDTYTPDHEPPLPRHLTFTSIQFSDVTVDLAFVRSELLTADAMHISEV